MKKNLKKVLMLFAVITCIFALAGCGSADKAEGSSTETVEQKNNDSITSILDNLAKTMQQNTYASLQAYLDQGSSYVSPIFDNSFSEAWSSFEDAHGTITETVVEPAVSSEGGFEGKVVATGEDGEQMAFTVAFNETGTPVKVFVEKYSTSDDEASMSSKMATAGMNTLMGVVIVFLMLLGLSALIYCFKFVNAAVNKKAKTAVEAKKAVPAPAAAPAVQEELVDDGELVAVIAAAIAASENTSTDSFVVRSIKRVKSNKWQRA